MFTFFYENKMILADRTLNFFPCNTKQEINLTLPYFYFCWQSESLLSGYICSEFKCKRKKKLCRLAQVQPKG